MKRILFFITTLLCFVSCGNKASNSKTLFAVNIEGGMAYFQSPAGELFFCNRFDHVEQFSEGLAGVEINGKWGFIDKEGKQVIPCIYEDSWSFSKGLAKVAIDGKWGFIDKDGKQVIPCIYDDAGLFLEGLAPIKLNGMWGVIDKEGKQVAPCIYDDAGFFFRRASSG